MLRHLFCVVTGIMVVGWGGVGLGMPILFIYTPIFENIAQKAWNNISALQLYRHNYSKEINKIVSKNTFILDSLT